MRSYTETQNLRAGSLYLATAFTFCALTGSAYQQDNLFSFSFLAVL